MEQNYDEICKKMAEGAPEESPASKPSPKPLPVLPVRHKRFKPADSMSSGWSALYERLVAVIDMGVNIVLLGQRGCGKTQLAVCLIRKCCLLGKSAEYKKVFDIFLRIRSAGDDSYDSEVKAVNDFVEPYLLVIDAFEVRANTPFEARVLDHIIDKRYDAMKSTVIISNDTEENVRSVLGESVCDRIRETGGITTLSHSSFRANGEIRK